MPTNVIAPDPQVVAALLVVAGESPAVNVTVDAGVLDAPSSELCSQCGEAPGVCFLPLEDTSIDLTMVPDRRDPTGRSNLGVVKVCNGLCVPCALLVIEAMPAGSEVAIDVTPWVTR